MHIAKVVAILILFDLISIACCAEVRKVGGLELRKHLLANGNQLPAIYADKLRVGLVGTLERQRFGLGTLINYEFQVFQVLSGKNSALIACEYEYQSGEIGRPGQNKRVLFRINKFDFARHVDGKPFWPFGPFMVVGTYQYVNTAGATKTVFDLEPVDTSQVQSEVESELTKRGESSSPFMRAWRLKGSRTFEGIFISCGEDDTVALFRQRDGSIIRVGINDLIDADRIRVMRLKKTKERTSPKFRTWTDKKGRKVEATFTAMEKRIVTLRGKHTTAPIRIRFDDLSSADKKWIGEHLKELKKRVKQPKVN